MRVQKNLRPRWVLITGTSFGLCLTSGPTLSQEVNSSGERGAVLEEVVVTAQQRQQTLQEVPISLEVTSGDDLLTQGIRNVNELSDFSPTLRVDSSGHSGGVQIRGVGTVGANLSFEQAVPIIVDGQHFGRRAQSRAAFLDVERVEVLRGPQPVYFGQNASAGAINITSVKPTPDWQGRLTTEVGNNAAVMTEFGVGGPITDTLGIRVSGKFDQEDGYMRDIVTRDPYPFKESYAGRVILQWDPTDKLTTTFKLEHVDYEVGSEARHVSLSGNGEFDYVEDANAYLATGIDGVTTEPLQYGVSNWGVRKSPPWLVVPDDLLVAGTSSRPHLVFDLTPIAETLRWPMDPDTGEVFSYGGNTFAGTEMFKPWNSYLKFDYRFDNGVLLEAQTAYSKLERAFNRHPDAGGPFLLNPMWRTENVEQWSQELTLTSEPDGSFIDWMAMLYWQTHENDITSDSWRADQHRQLAGNRSEDDATWYSAAGLMTFNFMDGQLALDVGGRYTRVEKEGRAQNIYGYWILELPEGADPNDPIIIDRPAPGQVVIERNVRTADPAIWHKAKVVGYLPPVRDPSLMHDEKYTTNKFDPQVVLRWTPSDDMSFYARYAEAFKAGGFDTAVTSITRNADAFQYDDENVESVEVGMKGSFFDGRMETNLALSSTDFYDLQMSSPDPGSDPAGLNVTRNAAHQRVQAFEFSGRYAVSDQMLLGFEGALMDGEMVEFPYAVCTQAEFDAGTTTDPNAVGICRDHGTFTSIDRSGQDALYTPDWSVTAEMNYWRPVFGDYEFTVNALVNHSDGYAHSYLDTLPMPIHTNLNLTLGFGPEDGTWRVSAFVRNMFETLPEYDPSADLDPDGLVETDVVSPSHFRRYGVSFRYSF